MKGQASIELLVTLGIVLAFTIPMLFLLLTVTSVGYENTSLAQAEASARSLSDSVNLVYGQGIGAKRVVLLNLPSNTNSIEIGENEVTITLTTSSGVFEASAPVFANVRSTTITRDSGPMAGLIALQLEAARSGGELEVQAGFVDEE